MKSFIQDLFGTQMLIESDADPAWGVTLFHVTTSLEVGDHVTSGQVLGTHASNSPFSDVAVFVATPTGQRLVSYFEALTPDAFDEFAPYGITQLSQMIISKEDRDADSLSCTGELFDTTGTLTNWVQRQPAVP